MNNNSFIEDPSADRSGTSLVGHLVGPKSTIGATSNDAFWTGRVTSVGRRAGHAVYLITEVNYPNNNWERCPLPDRYEPVYRVTPE